MLRLTRAQRSQVRRATTRLMTRERREYPSSSGTRTYLTIILHDGRIECSCQGWTFKKRGAARWCKHADAIANGRDVSNDGEYCYITEYRFAAITEEATQ